MKFTKTKLVNSLAVMALCALSSQVHAIPTISIDVVAADWTNLIGGTNINYVDTDGVAGNEEIRWGEPLNDGQSGYRFDSAAPISGIVIDTDFTLGDFTHFNFPIKSGGAITSAQLDLSVDMTIDGNPLSEGPFTFSFLHTETPNSADPCAEGGTNPCPDLVGISSLTSSDTFLIDGVAYTIDLTGFLLGDGTTVTEFLTDEKETNTAELLGVITLASVPEPSVLALLGLGFISIFGVSRAAKKKTLV